MMRPTTNLALIGIGLLSPAPAFAHHAMGGDVPMTLFQGFFSGLAHPIIGLDHFLILVVVGLLALTHGLANEYLAPSLLVVGALAGTSLHLAGVNLSGAEMLIAASVALGGGLVLVRRRLSVLALSLFFATAGILHGYAYGESIVGAQNAPLFAYLAGVALIQWLVIAAMAPSVAKLSAWTQPTHFVRVERLAGGLAMASGALLLALRLV